MINAKTVRKFIQKIRRNFHLWHRIGKTKRVCIKCGLHQTSWGTWTNNDDYFHQRREADCNKNYVPPVPRRWQDYRSFEEMLRGEYGYHAPEATQQTQGGE